MTQKIKPSDQVIKSIGFTQLWRREWQVKLQDKGQWLYSLALFLLIMILFPLAMGTEQKILTTIAVPAVWIACLLSQILGAENLFRPALENGTLAQLIVARASISLWVLIKLIIHWLMSAGLLSLLSLLTVPLFTLSLDNALMLQLSLVVASPMMLMLSAVASSLTVSLKNGAVLVPLLVLPLQLPILIFSTGAVEFHAVGMNAMPILALLSAGSILSVLSLPWVIAYILRMSWLN